MSDGDLKACPFCSGDAVLSYYMRGESKEVAGFYVECNSCWAGGEPFDIQGEAPDRDDYTRSKAIAAWNTRATTGGDAGDALDWALDHCKEPVFFLEDWRQGLASEWTDYMKWLRATASMKEGE